MTGRNNFTISTVLSYEESISQQSEYHWLMAISKAESYD